MARTNVVTCTPSTPLREVVELMVERGVGSVVVVDPANPRRPVGIVGERDVLRALALGADLSTPVSQVMSKLLVTVDAEAHVGEAVLAMREHNVRRVVVLKGGELYGVVALRDIVYNIPCLKRWWSTSKLGNQPARQRGVDTSGWTRGRSFAVEQSI